MTTVAVAQLADIAINVKNYEAVEGGVVDFTAAFNVATEVTAVHTGNECRLRKRIILPPGGFLVSGELCVREGQDIWGFR